MRGYRMVIRTFRQPRANKPVDAQGLTSSSAPVVNQGGSEPVDEQRLTSSSAPFVI